MKDEEQKIFKLVKTKFWCSFLINVYISNLKHLRPKRMKSDNTVQ